MAFGFILTNLNLPVVKETAKLAPKEILSPVEQELISSHPGAISKWAFERLPLEDQGKYEIKSELRTQKARAFAGTRSERLYDINVRYDYYVPKSESSLPVVTTSLTTSKPATEAEPVQAGFGGSPLMMLIIFGFLAFAFSKRR